MPLHTNWGIIAALIFALFLTLAETATAYQEAPGLLELSGRTKTYLLEKAPIQRILVRCAQG